MSRLIDRPIRVTVAENGHPRRFFWRGKQYRVRRILELWLDIGAWWEGEPEKAFWRVETSEGGIFELYRERQDPQTWYLYKIYD